MFEGWRERGLYQVADVELWRLEIAFWVDDGALQVVEMHCYCSIECIGNKLARISDGVFDV